MRASVPLLPINDRDPRWGGLGKLFCFGAGKL